MGQTPVTQAQWRVVAEPPRGLAPQAIRGPFAHPCGGLFRPDRSSTEP
jgi:formylglycine-generating enzyme required for sulfatase activity